MDTIYTKILSQELSNRMDKNHAYSLRAFAKALKVAPSALSEILSGKRIPSHKMGTKIIQALDLSPVEQEKFIQSIAQSKKRAGIKRMNPALKEALKSDLQKEEKKELSLDLFRVIGDWYHYSILFLTEVKGFKSNPKWIASQLGITEAEAKMGIDRLLSFGLLTKTNGQFKIWSKEFTTADKHLTTSALRRHMKQILEKAIYSLENDPIEKRSITAMTMAVDEAKLDRAKEMIEDFTQKLSKFLESGQKNKVYELNINLFPMQRSKE